MEYPETEERPMTARTAKRLIAPALILAALALAASAQGQKPRAAFKATAHDFGKVKQGDVVSHEFTFRNEGGAPLVVERIETTCGCTAALVSEKTIAPGGAGRIKTTFDTRGYSGRMTRYLYLVSNDAREPRRELSVSADIEVPPSARIDVDRFNVDMGLVLEGEEPAARIVVKSTGERELKIEMAHEVVRFFSGGRPLASAVSLPVGESREIEMRFPAQTRPGVQRDYVLIRSNDPVRSTLSIYVSRYVVTRKELRELFEKYGQVIRDSD
jgi:hypothetical protein